MRYEFLPAFKGDCFLIHAGTADEPVLILVDGGPAGTYQQHLRTRLMALRDERGLDGATPLVIDLVIVSHVDDDHVNGIVDLFRELFEAATLNDPAPFEVRGLWHNSFDEIIGNDIAASEARHFGAASFGPSMEEADEQGEVDAGLILQSVAQGHELRELAQSPELAVPINEGFDKLVMTATGAATRRTVGGVTFTILGPRRAELQQLQKAHDDWLEEQRARGKPITPGSLLQSLTDDSVANLSSIVLLAEADGRSALLTGDARSDFIVKAMEETGLIAAGGAFSVDLLKMPHHGSDRNVDADFLRRVTAPAYLVTGNGEHGNPERGTFEMLRDARPGAAMAWHLTYPVAQIDHERRRDWDKERGKEQRKAAAGKLKPPKQVRPAWSEPDHSLAALKAALPPGVRMIEPDGPVILT